jgi:hypothetical protein
MIRTNFSRVVTFSICAMLLFGACRKREGITLPDNLVTFNSTELGMSESETSLPVKVKLSRGTDKEVEITVNFTTQGVTYGTDFTTTPAAVSGVISVVVPMGNNEATFTITKAPNALFDGDEKINFELHSSASPVLIGAVKTFTLEFKELVAANSSMLINGGGATYPNKVFIDLSANRQTPVLRTNWDLGFYSDPTDFRVILNSTVGMMAKQIDKSDLNLVSATDTAGFTETVAYSPFAPDPSQMPYVDYPNGDITRTAIAPISATATDNKVYIINRGSGIGSPAPARGWKKIRVIRNANGGYTVQHADIAATSFTSVDIPKNAAYFFNYFSFESGAVTVEPEKTKWDIAWNYGGFLTNFGGGEVPYMFQDLIFQNRNVQVAKVLSSTKAYESFTEASLTDGTIPAASWNSSQVSIGSDWRQTTPSPAQARSDRYYIVMDGNNNYYKLKFTGLTDGGVRGFPAIAYELIKRG